MEPPSKVQELTQWFSENGGHLHGAIAMRHDFEYGYHYVNQHGSIDLEEVVCRCPFSLTLSYLNIMPTSLGGIRNCFSASLCSKLGENQHIQKRTIAIFFLVEQRLKGMDSFWFPYIQLLPTEAEMTTPLWFKEDELVYLRGTNLLSNDSPREQTSLGREEELYREQWQLGIVELRNAGQTTTDLTWESFLWAATIFSSRSFTSELFTNGSANDSFPILYPVLDTFNHRLGVKVRWQLDKGDFILSLKEKVEQGQQIFNNYSAKGNEDLLMGFGFCIPDNPYDQVAIRLGPVQPKVHDRLREGLPSHWKSKTWDPKESVFYLQAAPQNMTSYPTGNCALTLDYLRGLAPKLARSVYIIVLESRKATTPLKEGGNEKQIWGATIGVLLQHMEHKLREVRKWDAKLPISPTTPGAKAALIYRMGQIKIIEEVSSDLKLFMGILQEGNVDIRDLY